MPFGERCGLRLAHTGPTGLGVYAESRPLSWLSLGSPPCSSGPIGGSPALYGAGAGDRVDEVEDQEAVNQPVSGDRW